MAVRMLASWCNTLSPEQILEALGQVKSTTNPLEAALDAFWNALSPGERRRLALLALFEGAFSLTAAQEVADASLFFLDALAAKTYLSRRRGGRFYLHPLLRRYARTRLQAFPADAARAERRHALWYLEHLPAAAGARSEAARWAFLASEEDIADLTKAWHWALEHREARLLLQAAPWVYFSLGELNRFPEAVALVETSLADLKQWPPARRKRDYFLLRAYLETASAEYHYHLGHYRRALHIAGRVYRRQFACLPPLHQAHTAAVLGRVRSAVGEYASAIALMEAARQIYQREGARPLLLAMLNAIGIAAYGQGDLATAEQFFSEALALSREEDNPRTLAALFNNLGNIAWRRGHSQQAERLLNKALQLLEGEAPPSLKASVLDSIARVACDQKAYRRALAHLNEAITLTRRINAWPNALVAMTTVARVWLESGHAREAADLLATVMRSRELPHYDYAQVQEVMQRLPEGRPLDLPDLEALARYVLRQNRRRMLELDRQNLSSGGLP